MTYIDGYVDREKNIVHIVERNAQGARNFVTYPTQYAVYWPQPQGKHTSIFGDRLSKFQTSRYQEFQRELRMLAREKLLESDIDPLFRCLYQNYRQSATPQLHVGFFDIETDFDPERGYSTPEEAFNEITAVSVYLAWMQRCFTLVVKPRSWSQEQAQTVVDQFPDTMLCETETELLDIFLQLIEDCDIISGWNSTSYDMPYIYKRILLTLGKEHTRRLCLWNRLPTKREFEMYGKRQVTYEIVGRVHLDYLDLYRKHTYQELHSYKLDFVGEHDTGDRKVPYEGSLDQLYNRDFGKFIEYNRQDVMLLVKIDQKRRLIELCNNLAHQNCVLLATTRGSVKLIDQAIVNEAWDNNLIVPNRPQHADDRDDDLVAEDEDDEDFEQQDLGIVGAYVADPVQGMHEWIGGVDINSLYPSTIRALNMSPETIVGHIRPEQTQALIKKRMTQEKKTFAESWQGMFGTLEFQEVQKRSDIPLIVDFTEGGNLTVTAGELAHLVYKGGRGWIISANGTIFSQDKNGIIPQLLARWYADRKKMQAEMKNYASQADKETDPDKKAEYQKLTTFYDQRQLIQKILLNSLYGAIGNSGSRFFDERVAQSVTLSGRCIVKHMQGKINEIITGSYDHLGASCIYGDTDSGYFSAYPVMKDLPEFQDFAWTKEAVVDLYDKIADLTNASFPEFMNQAFNCPERNGAIIRAGRELCAERGIFIKKKRYAVLIFDKEGKRKDTDGKPGEIKAMGLDLKRSDTPRVVQEFLMSVLTQVLTGSEQQQVIDNIFEFRKEFSSWPGWIKGTPKRVNKLSHYQQAKTTNETWSLTNKTKKTNLPGHVRASLNWNTLLNLYNDHSSVKIQDGSKIIVCKLRDNSLNMTSIAYPIDQDQLPTWFKQLPWDHAEMETALIDKKIKNLLGVLNWDLDSSRKKTSASSLFF